MSIVSGIIGGIIGGIFGSKTVVKHIHHNETIVPREPEPEVLHTNISFGEEYPDFECLEDKMYYIVKKYIYTNQLNEDKFYQLWDELLVASNEYSNTNFYVEFEYFGLKVQMYPDVCYVCSPFNGKTTTFYRR